MQFKPMSASDIAKQALIAEGTYDFEVVGAEDKISSKGNPMIVAKLKLYLPSGHERLLKDYLMEAMAFKLRHFCYATGLGDKYESGEFTAGDCVGRAGKVRIVQREARGDFGPQNEVKDYIVSETVQEKPAPNASPQQVKPAHRSMSDVNGGMDPNEPPF